MIEARSQFDVPRLKRVAERHGHILEPWSLLEDLTSGTPRTHAHPVISDHYEGGIVCNACGARAVVGTWRPWVESSLLRPCKVIVMFKEDLQAARREYPNQQSDRTGTGATL